MNLKYRGDKYSLKFKDWIKVKLIISKLRFIRIKRLFSRLISYARNLYLVFICLIIYLLLIYLFGKHLNLYDSMIEALWDSKTVVFTSIIITYIINAQTLERNRHERLIIQHEKYMFIMFDSEYLIKKLCTYLPYDEKEYDLIFYTRERYDNFIQSIDSIQIGFVVHSNNIDRLKDFLSYSNYNDEILRQIERLFKSYLNQLNSNQIENYSRFVPDVINNCINRINEEKIILSSLNDYKEYLYELRSCIKDVAWFTYQLVEELRIPWRQDNYLNQKIRIILYKNNARELDFFSSKFMQTN